ncbi:hypothetical protein MKZ38_009257 [Zalerion maritima]|uniref:Glutathione S-transferase n=1 Tax=Zalerion maritima TaxID=339359 RepID=A0AAD5RTI5_9PEZI|nr:hypothetical protein MKZ38_009257 [Zalerion maritima]
MSTIDTSIDPKPTGSAAILAAEHSAPHPLILYGGWFCPFVQRTWIVLTEKCIPYQYIEINPYKKAPEFIALNPRGLVPTLAVPSSQTSGSSGEGQTQALYESNIVCEYLDEEYRGEVKFGPSLLPGTSYERARCKLWMDHISSKIVPSFYKLLQHTPEKAYLLDEAREQLHAGIKTLTREMKEEESGPWFLGDTFTMVDVCLAPWAKRLWLIDHYKPGGCGFPEKGEAGEEEEVWRRWRLWLDAILHRESVLKTSSSDEMYIDVYRRYAEDTTSSLVGQATRKGERLP